MDNDDPVSVSEHLEKLSHELRQYTSLKAVFIRGIVYGVATALGATVVAAIVFGALYRVAEPVLDQFSLGSSVLDSMGRE